MNILLTVDEFALLQRLSIAAEMAGWNQEVESWSHEMINELELDSKRLANALALLTEHGFINQRRDEFGGKPGSWLRITVAGEQMYRNAKKCPETYMTEPTTPEQTKSSESAMRQLLETKAQRLQERVEAMERKAQRN